MFFKIKKFINQQSETNLTIRNVLKQIKHLQEGITKMALNLDALMAEVEHTKGVQESAIHLLKNLTSELADISAKLAATPKEMTVDTSGLDELVGKLKSSTDALADAVAANSPAPAPVDMPEPAPEMPAEAPVVDVPVEPETPVDGAPV